jgi:glycosyltransferase involved in cell wall biosynthesis
VNNFNIDISKFEIKLTLSDDEFEKFKSISFLKNLGRLNVDQMNLEYQQTDILLFLSNIETYGLPLIEAMTFKLPILVADFNYSRWVCEEQAYYFKPNDYKSFISSLNVLVQDLKNNKTYKYDNVLKKFPNNWNQVVEVFILNLEKR